MAHSSSEPPRREAVPGAQGSRAAATRNLLRKKEQRRRGIRSNSPMGRVILINSPVDGGDDSEDIHTITVDKNVDGRLGFSVRGGSEHGLSIFVSKVEDHSTAEQSGLRVGDKLVEVNSVSLENITMSSAVRVLTGNNRLRMVIRRVGKVPGIRYSKEKVTWVDLIHKRMVVEESGRTPSEASASSGGVQRIIHIYTTSDDYCLGFNIRGGKEFGLGIYVSKLDPGGVGEQNGIKMGDQILAANGISFNDISHSSAVEVLKSHTHIMLTIKEAGRYPAYKEMVAEYRWLNKLANGAEQSSQGSDTNSSSTSSVSSGTPVSSLSGLSQVMFPPSLPFGLDMVDVCISTEDQRYESGHTEIAIQTDYADTSRSLGATTLLRDTLIRGGEDGDGERGRRKKESTKTAVLLALSRPSRPITRSQSQVTLAEIDQKKDKKKQKARGPGEEKSSTLQRSKTLINLLFRGGRKRDTSRGRSKSPSKEGGRGAKPDPAMLGAVEDMSRRLLSEDEVTSVMKACRRYVTVERSVENFVLRLVEVLDRPEKLLLLREIRMLLAPADLEPFNSMVNPFEVEAYDILKYRSLKTTPLRSPASGRAPKRHLITPIPDYQGGFELCSSREVERERHLQEELERLRVSGSRSGAPARLSRERRTVHTSGAFSPLLDIPVDGYDPEPRHAPPPPHASAFSSAFSSASASVSSSSSSPLPPIPNWLLAHAADPRPPRRSDASPARSVHFHDEATASVPAERGRSALKNGHSKGKGGGGGGERRGGGGEGETVYTLTSRTTTEAPAPHRRPLLSHVFSPGRPPTNGAGAGAGGDEARTHGHDDAAPQNRLNGTAAVQEYELQTVSISKTKQSLGISISGGMESKIQPVVKIEKIFPGGAASTCDVLKAGFELVSVDGVTLQGVTHQHAVDLIRRAFSNKAKDPMVFIVKVPVGPANGE